MGGGGGGGGVAIISCDGTCTAEPAAAIVHLQFVSYKCRWKLNNSVGGAPGFLGAFGASCGSGGVRSVRQWCAVREQARAQVRVQVRAGAASFVQCGVRAVRL